MARLLPLLLLMFGLSRAPAVAQATGTLAGRISDAATGERGDRDAAALPGVRVTATHSGGRDEAVTDASGRFSFAALPFGDYDITASLPGFTPVTGRLTLSATRPIAQLDWALKVGCLQEVVQVVIDLPQAAREASEIVHLRVDGEGASTQWSTIPECGFSQAREYPVTVVSGAPGGRTAAAGHAVARLLTEAREPLAPGAEYLMLLRWDVAFERHWTMGPYYMARIEAGRVARGGPEALQGLSVAAALERLQQWAGK